MNGVAASLDGVMDTRDPEKMEGAHQLADRVISQDAVVKLRLAVKNLETTGQPFFLAAGKLNSCPCPNYNISRPHS